MRIQVQNPDNEIISRYKITALIVAFAVFLVILFLPKPEGIAVEAWRILAVFVLSAILWITHALPLVITSILVICLCPLLGILSSKETFSIFGNQAVFFILSSFILASGMFRSGLSVRMAFSLLRLFKKSQFSLIFGVLISSAVFSLFMSEHAVAAMMLPIVASLIKSFNLKPLESRLGTALYLAMGWGCVLGGVGTLLGGARAPLAVGILKEVTGLSISFFSWMISALPLVIISIPLVFLFIMFVIKPEKVDINKAIFFLEKKCTDLGSLSRREIGFAILMTVTILAWMIWGELLGLAVLGLVSVVTAFVFKLLEWHEVEEDVNWGVILMYGGAITLGYAMQQTGAAAWVAEKFFFNFLKSSIHFIIFLSLASLFLTEVVSNTAVVAFLLPVSLGFSAVYGIRPEITVLLVSLPAGLAFQLPIGTPASAIIHSTGYIRSRQMFWGGLAVKILSWGVLMLLVQYIWPLLEKVGWL